MNQLSRRNFLKTSVSGMASFLALSRQNTYGNSRGNSSSLPNLVILVADDMGWNDVGYHGSVIETQNIDQLVADGVELDRFYAWPTCSPTRTGLMTGRSPIRSGITKPITGSHAGPPLDEHFLPQTFRAAGYQTWMCGKWHLDDEPYHPNNRGFDHFYGHIGGALDYYDHTEPNTSIVDWQRNGVTIDEEGYVTDLLAAEAISLIQNRDPVQPFLLYLPFNAPHTPLEAPDDLIEKYSFISNENRRLFAATVDAMDRAIGEVLTAIDNEGLTNDTLVLFFSDNGATRTRVGGGRNLPLSGYKGGLYEGGIRTPAAMRWPGVLPAGHKSEQFINVIDLFPTLATALSVNTKNTKSFDGINHWDQLRNQSPNKLPEAVVYIIEGASAVFDGQWKLIQTDAGDELYQIFADPTESQNLATDYPEVVQQLSAYITSWNDIMNSDCIADIDDLQILANQWLQTDPQYITTDYNCDGKVNFHDFWKLAQSWFKKFGCR